MKRCRTINRFAPAILAVTIWPGSAAAQPAKGPDTGSVVHSAGIRGRIADGKLRGAKLVFDGGSVTVEVEAEKPERFTYEELKILRGKHHMGGPFFNVWDLIGLAPAAAISAVSGGVAEAGLYVATALAAQSGFYLLRHLRRRGTRHWLSLHSASEHRCVFLRLPYDKERRRAILDEFEKRDPTELLTRERPAAGRKTQPEALPVGLTPPDFALTSQRGSEWRLSEARGKVVLLNFWASWCGPCRKEIPHLQDLHERYSDAGLEVAAITDENADVAAGFLEEMGVTYRALHDTDSQVFDRYRVRAIPLTLIVGRDGRLVRRIEGFIGRRSLQKVVSAHVTGREDP